PSRAHGDRARRDDDRLRMPQPRQQSNLRLAHDHFDRVPRSGMVAGTRRAVDRYGYAVAAVDEPVTSDDRLSLHLENTVIAFQVIIDGGSKRTGIRRALHRLMLVVPQARVGPETDDAQQCR